MSGFITDGQMTQLRSIANKGLFRVYNILRKTRVENDFGFEDVWDVTSTGMGWLRNMNKPKPGEMTGHIEGAEAVYRLHVEHGTDLRTGDRVSMEGHVYEVSDVNADNSYQIYTTGLLRLIQ